ncbi:MAG: hypothetical protein P4M12_01570 [Gammaproteobacteria bacterium]|nr:hypothetical protein [Gammaproteobacteria bacterium]
MKRTVRIIIAVAVTFVLGGMFAYQDADKYRSHPAVAIATDFFCGFLAALLFYFGSGWIEKRKQRNAAFNDTRLYDQVAKELNENALNPGLWTRAFAEMNGDEAKARALYIKYRVAQLGTNAHQELAVTQGEANLAQRQQVIRSIRRFGLLIFGWIFAVLSFLSLLLGILALSDNRSDGAVGAMVLSVPFTVGFVLVAVWFFVKAGIKFTKR